MPCCIDRMRFSPRFSIRKKITFTCYFFSSFFCQVQDLFASGSVRESSYQGVSLRNFAGNPSWQVAVAGRAGTSSGGSSAVEQRTVKCASAAILWSGVQISLSGFFIFVPGARLLFSGSVARGPATVIRSYHSESTASHPNCEVKHCWA